MFDPPDRGRARMVRLHSAGRLISYSLLQPRHIPHDGVLKTYSSREAIGQQWLREVDDGHFKDQTYVAHIGRAIDQLSFPIAHHYSSESEPSRQVCILTSTSIICAWTHRLRLCWDSPFSYIGTVSLDENGIRILDRERRETGFIIITERHDREWFYGQISKYVFVQSQTDSEC